MHHYVWDNQSQSKGLKDTFKACEYPSLWKHQPISELSKIFDNHLIKQLQYVLQFLLVYETKCAFSVMYRQDVQSRLYKSISAYFETLISGFYTKLNVWGSLGLNFEYNRGPIIEIGGPIFLYKLRIWEDCTSFHEGSVLSPGQ